MFVVYYFNSPIGNWVREATPSCQIQAQIFSQLGKSSRSEYINEGWLKVINRLIISDKITEVSAVMV